VKTDTEGSFVVERVREIASAMLDQLQNVAAYSEQG
jgi:hypothetical protein